MIATLPGSGTAVGGGAGWTTVETSVTVARSGV